MKVARNMFLGLVVTGAIVFVSGLSFAETATSAPAATANDLSAAMKAKDEVKIKLLNDSAAALQATNPDLAKKLSDFANEEANEPNEKLEGSKEQAAKDSPEWKVKHDARVQLCKDAAAALQTTKPDLAKGLMGLMDLTVAKPKIEMPMPITIGKITRNSKSEKK